MIHIAWIEDIGVSFFFLEEELEEYVRAWQGDTPLPVFSKVFTHESLKEWKDIMEFIVEESNSNLVFLTSQRTSIWESVDQFYEEFPELLL